VGKSVNKLQRILGLRVHEKYRHLVQLAPADRPIVFVTHMEHHSNIVPWQLLCERTGAVLKVVPFPDAGELILEEFERLLSMN